MFPPLGIVIGQTQPGKGEVWILMTQRLGSIGLSIEDCIGDCSQIVILRNVAIVKDMTV